MTKTELEEKLFDVIHQLENKIEKWIPTQYKEDVSKGCALISQSHAKETAEAFDVWKKKNIWLTYIKEGTNEPYYAKANGSGQATFTQLYDLYLESLNEK